MKRKRGLPDQLRPFFGEHRFSSIALPDDKDLVIRRILSVGSWEAVRWLRKEVGDAELREWLISHNGRGLSPRQLRFWELLYSLPAKQVNKWVQSAQSGVWTKR